MKNYLKSLVVGIAFSLSLAGAAFADALNVDSNGLAVQGYDVVAYFTQDKPVKGQSSFQYEHDGGTYYFSSGANRDVFASDPEKYVPAYGGYCAYGLAQGSKVPIEPDKFTIVDGKLYLNFNAPVQSTWEKDIPGYITKADKNWTTVGRDS